MNGNGMDPTSAAILGGSQLLTGMLGGIFGNKASAPSTVVQTPTNIQTADDSGWSVNFAPNSTVSATANPVSTLAQGITSAGSGLASLMADPLSLILICGVILFVVERK